MTLVEVTEQGDQPSVTVTEETVQATVQTAASPSAVEVPADVTVPEISGDPSAVEVQVPVANQVVTTVQTNEVIEVQVPVVSTVALPIEDPLEVVQVVVPGPQGVVGPAGSPGPRGDPGPAGSGASYTHNQNVAASTWTISHFLGFNPAGIVVEDSAGSVVEGEIAYPDTDTVVLTFTAAFGGVAYLS